MIHKNWLKRLCLLVTATSPFLGCGIGYDRLLFVTKTNIGLDIDSKPPTAELSIARREGVIAPAFEDGQTPPVIASYVYEGGWFNPRITSTFAGGRSAVVLSSADPTKVPAHGDAKDPGKMCLRQQPDFGLLAFEDGDSVRPFYFATDTGFGLKVAWSGMTTSVPDTLRMGYSRKEFAFAPIFGAEKTGKSESESGSTPSAQSTCNYEMHTPSFLASVDNAISVDGPTVKGNDRKFSQFFATGAAADNLAADRDVRASLRARVVAAAANAATSDGGRDEASDSIAATFAAFNAASPDTDKQASILAEAKELGLVESTTTLETFEADLAKNAAEPNARRAALAKLRDFAKAQ